MLLAAGVATENANDGSHLLLHHLVFSVSFSYACAHQRGSGTAETAW